MNNHSSAQGPPFFAIRVCQIVFYLSLPSLLLEFFQGSLSTFRDLSKCRNNPPFIQLIQWVSVKRWLGCVDNISTSNVKRVKERGKIAVSLLQQLTNEYWQFYSTNTSLRAGSQWFEVGTWRACSTARMRRLNKGKEVMSDVVSQSVATFFYYLRGIGCPNPVEKTYRTHIQRPTGQSQRAYLPSCLPK